MNADPERSRIPYCRHYYIAFLLECRQGNFFTSELLVKTQWFLISLLICIRAGVGKLIVKLKKQKNVATLKFHHVYLGLKIMNRLTAWIYLSGQ
jgi:hypothetical protein